LDDDQLPGKSDLHVEGVGDRLYAERLCDLDPCVEEGIGVSFEEREDEGVSFSDLVETEIAEGRNASHEGSP
jgi:hypothetical protein